MMKSGLYLFSFTRLLVKTLYIYKYIYGLEGYDSATQLSFILHGDFAFSPQFLQVIWWILCCLGNLKGFKLLSFCSALPLISL